MFVILFRAAFTSGVLFEVLALPGNAAPTALEGSCILQGPPGSIPNTLNVQDDAIPAPSPEEIGSSTELAAKTRGTGGEEHAEGLQGLNATGAAVSLKAPDIAERMLALDATGTSRRRPIFARRGLVYQEKLRLKVNGYGDLRTFLFASTANIFMALCSLCLFGFLRHWYAPVFDNGHECHSCKMMKITSTGQVQWGAVPRHRQVTKFASDYEKNSFLGWVVASWRLVMQQTCVDTKPDEVELAAGLDKSMLIVFFKMALEIMLLISLPHLVVFLPITFHYGRLSLEALDRFDVDRLTWFGLNSVPKGQQLPCWLYGVFVWYVVVTVERVLFKTQQQFVMRRIRWLRNMSYPRCNSILVESIPRDWCTDAAVRTFFNNIFDDDVVEHVHVLRETKELERLVEFEKRNDERLLKAEGEHVRTGRRPRHTSSMNLVTAPNVDSIEYYKKRQEGLQIEIAQERLRLETSAVQPETAGEVLCNCAFVTFRSRLYREHAMKHVFTTDRDEFVVSAPPDPADVDYGRLQDSHSGAIRRTKDSLGYLAMLGMFLGFLPLVVLITSAVEFETVIQYVGPVRGLMTRYPWVETLWRGLAGPLALLTLNGFIPTFLMIVLRAFFDYRSEGVLQHELQQWYFVFLNVFVLFVAIIGNSLVATVQEIWNHPGTIFELLAKTLPLCTHFYLIYVPAQWSTTTLVGLRWVVLGKFIGLRKIFDDTTAKELAEPEDQDWYGMGARTAHSTLILNIGIIMCSLCPLITVVVGIFFVICLFVYPYLITFAESVKEDLGGVFWCSQMKHIQSGVFIYVVLMSSILYERANTSGPPALAASAGVYLVYSYWRFQRAFFWKHLPFSSAEDLKPTTRGQPRTTPDVYYQEVLSANLEPVVLK